MTKLSQLNKEKMNEILEHASGTTEILGAIRSLSAQIEKDKEEARAEKEKNDRRERWVFAVELTVGLLTLGATVLFGILELAG